MIRITIKYTDPSATIAALIGMGFEVNPEPSQSEAYFPRGNTPPEKDKDGTYFITGLLTEEDTALIQPSDAFEIIWDSRDLVNVGTEDEPVMQMKPRPMYETEDEESNVRNQLVGWI